VKANYGLGHYKVDWETKKAKKAKAKGRPITTDEFMKIRNYINDPQLRFDIKAYDVWHFYYAKVHETVRIMGIMFQYIKDASY
jgi:uncharacterized protein (DUF849 family)